MVLNMDILELFRGMVHINNLMYNKNSLFSFLFSNFFHHKGLVPRNLSAGIIIHKYVLWESTVPTCFFFVFILVHFLCGLENFRRKSTFDSKIPKIFQWVYKFSRLNFSAFYTSQFTEDLGPHWKLLLTTHFEKLKYFIREWLSYFLSLARHTFEQTALCRSTNSHKLQNIITPYIS